MAGKALRHKLEAMALKAALGLFGALPLERASAFGAFIAGTLGPRLGVTNRARANMARTMPELAPAEREAIIKKMWRNLGRTIGEYAHLHEFQLPAHRGKLGLSGTENLSVMEERDKGAIFISGHFGNWEIAPLIGRLYGLEGAEIYRHANNPYVDEWMVGLRARAITPLQIPKGSKGAREILKVLKEKKSLYMLVDQKMNEGLETTFFGHKAMTTAAPAGLAVRYGVPIYPISFRRLGESTGFAMKVNPPILADENADTFEEIARITQAMNDFLEGEIRAHPEQWFWLHNRWPKHPKP